MENVVVFTGAGISKDSGIPTFAEIEGIRDILTRDFANNFPEEYSAKIEELRIMCENKEPNSAHYAIVKLDCPVITMNIDRLHQKAGSKDVIEVHGAFEDNSLVLYGDKAPKYSEALKTVLSMEPSKGTLLIVGTSFYTLISAQIRDAGYSIGADVVVINDNATFRVPHEVDRLLREQRIRSL